MNASFSAAIALLFSGATLLAQTPTMHVSTPHSYTSEFGFRYDLPGDWEALETKASMAQAKQQAAQNASSEQEKKGLACVQMGQTARRESSVIVDVALPFDCFGQELSDADLPGFGQGVSQGIKQSFDIGDAANGAYTLGNHKMWVQRVKGTLRGQTEPQFTLETACAILKKAAVCWMTMAADDAALQTFEHTTVSLDGDNLAPLVPAMAFEKKP